MNRRSDLDDIFEEILGNENVYFQPPESRKMHYPCIVYNRAAMPARYANDKKYFGTVRYNVTVITKDPDSEIVQKVWELPLCSHNRHFASDNLNHDVFELYY